MSAPMTLEELQTLLEELFPVDGGSRSMELADAPAVCQAPAERRESEDSLRLAVRLLNWDGGRKAKKRSLRDIREQQICLGPVSVLQRGDRLEAFLRGTCDALQQIFDAKAEIETLMPHDLWRPEVLKLTRPKTADDFCRAILVPSRLGCYLPR